MCSVNHSGQLAIATTLIFTEGFAIGGEQTFCTMSIALPFILYYGYQSMFYH